MPLGEIIEKAFRYTWKNKALWFYGVILAIFTAGGGNNFNLTEEQQNSIIEQIPKENLVPLLIGGGILLVLFVVLSLILGSWAEAALIRGAKEVDEGKEITRKEIGKTGKSTIWKLIILNFIIPMGFILGLTIVIGLGAVGVIALNNQVANTIGIILLVLLALVGIPALIYVGTVWFQAVPYVVIEEKRVVESLKLAFGLIKGKFWWTLLFNIVVGLISGGVALAFMIPLLALGAGAIYSFVNKVTALGGVLAVLALVYLLFFVLGLGIVQAFTKVGQTLWWFELRKSKLAQNNQK